MVECVRGDVTNLKRQLINSPGLMKWRYGVRLTPIRYIPDKVLNFHIKTEEVKDPHKGTEDNVPKKRKEEMATKKSTQHTDT